MSSYQAPTGPVQFSAVDTVYNDLPRISVQLLVYHQEPQDIGGIGSHTREEVGFICKPFFMMILKLLLLIIKEILLCKS